MSEVRLSLHAFSISAVAAMLTGCAGQQLTIRPPALLQEGFQSREIVEPRSAMPMYKVSGPLLYAANADLTLTPLAVYNARADNPKPIATIKKDIDNSGGICIDGDGTLYVANEPPSGPGWVSEYALGQTKPLRVITKGINVPASCAIDASGNLWVTNIGLDDVAEYTRGSTKPRATVTNGLTYPDGIAIDREGNLYVGNLQPHSAPNIQVYTSGSKSPSRTITDGVTWPVGIAVDAHDTLYVANDTAQGNVEEYRAGHGKPFVTITDELSYPAGIVVGKNAWLYVANAGQYSDETAILEFPPHSVKPSSKRITQGLFHPSGVAYYPPLLP